MPSYPVASGIFSFWPINLSFEVDVKYSAGQFILPATIGANLLASGLLVARLIYAQRMLASATSHYVKSPYMTALAICVESSAIIVVWAIISLASVVCMVPLDIRIGSPIVLAESGPARDLFPIIIFPQICVRAILPCNQT